MWDPSEQGQQEKGRADGDTGNQSQREHCPDGRLTGSPSPQGPRFSWEQKSCLLLLLKQQKAKHVNRSGMCAGVDFSPKGAEQGMVTASDGISRAMDGGLGEGLSRPS